MSAAAPRASLLPLSLLLLSVLPRAAVADRGEAFAPVVQAMEAEAWDDAAAALAPYLEAHPRDADAALLMARVLSWSGRHDEALARYEAYLERFGPDPVAQREEAMVLYWAGRYDLAIRRLMAILDRDPENLELLSALIHASLYSDDLAHAEVAVERLARLAPAHPDVAMVSQRLEAARRMESRSRAGFLADTESYLQFELGTELSFTPLKRVRVTPRVGYGYYEKAIRYGALYPEYGADAVLRYAHGLDAGLRARWSPSGFVSVWGEAGYEQHIQPEQAGPPHIYYGVPTARLGLDARLPGGPSLGVYAAFGLAQRRLQTLSFTQNAPTAAVLGARSYWQAAERFGFGGSLDLDAYLTDDALETWRWTANLYATGDLIVERWLFAGYQAYMTGFGAALPQVWSAWSPDWSMSHEGVLGSRFARWGREGGLTASASAGVAIEAPHPPSPGGEVDVSVGLALGARLSAVIVDQEPFKLEADVGYRSSVREQTSYGYVHGNLVATVRF
jgi:tetratricopeptide (TPR) repeat protein